MVVSNNESTTTKNVGKSLAILIAMHRRMEHIQGFTRSHWMPPSAECLRRIAPAAAMVNEFE